MLTVCLALSKGPQTLPLLFSLDRVRFNRDSHLQKNFGFGKNQYNLIEKGDVKKLKRCV